MCPTAADDPALSIVVGTRRGFGPESRCRRALEPQLGPEIEVIVVDDDEAGESPPWARRLCRPGALVPELWAEGLAVATGRMVALLSGDVVPAANWVALAAAGPPEAAMGGVVEPGPAMGLVDWAIYFCRYTPYMAPVSTGVRPAADNVVYRADVVTLYRDLWRDGFWEPFVHQAMARDGHGLVMSDELRVALAGGGSARSFASQRFGHGKAHGRLRSQGSSRLGTLAGVATAPVVPLIMAYRSARLVAAKGRHRARFVSSLPLVLYFYSWWAAGEAAGRIEALGGRRP